MPLKKKKEVILKGIPAAPGIACRPAFILDKQDVFIPSRAILEKEVPVEIARFEEALIKTREEILNVQAKISKEMGVRHAQIFDAHLLVLEDRTVIQEVIKDVKKQKLCVEIYIFVLVFVVINNANFTVDDLKKDHHCKIIKPDIHRNIDRAQSII